ncbi:hypothetical protein BFP70_16115 [Thioclava sp. SK-1]|uniref:AbrB family transcriptional regulator n=1 Tax=Thioclava sp. SK-1 TaxID=1889770 RepID=UPI000824CD28|nr:AbrB family transcriptional regulator [Thioclava sp. SK-1]OCX60989.1 hypothetical protein BFP70_16115 [Thioclava sp. SK-1]
MQLICLMIGGGTLSWLLSLIHMPAALLLGPLTVAIVLGVRGTRIVVSPHAMAVSQGVVGILIAQYLTPDMLDRIVAMWPVVVLFAAMTLALAGVVGVAMGAMTRVDPEVSIWGFLPGMASAVIVMSQERGIDSRLVAFLQITRVLVVIVVMSAVSRALIEDPAGPVATAAPATAMGVVATLVIAIVGPILARFIPLPAGATLLPLMAAVVWQMAGGITLDLPLWLLVVTYFILGTQVGLRFTPEILHHALSVLWPVILGSLALMALCGLSGLALAKIVGVDLMTGILATVPGSIETIAIIAVHSEANLSFIMTMQVIRLFAVVLFGPTMARALSGWMARGEKPLRR